DLERQAQAGIRPAHGCRRSRGRDQCRKGSPHGPQAPRQGLPLAHRIHRRSPRGQRREDDQDASRAHDRVGGAGDAPQESSRPGDGQETEGLPGRDASSSGSATRRASRVAGRTEGRPLMAVVERFYGTGRRKTSVARVWLRSGQGRIAINRRAFENYFPRETLRMIIAQPLAVTNTVGQVDILVSVGGGGPTGQAGAVRHGIARALVRFDEKLRQPLKKAGLLTRDPRMRERKKYGQPGARQKFQYSKR